MNATYKTLVEVKLMHEYFLTDKDGNLPFSFSDPADRQQFVDKRFAEGRASMHRDIEFRFPEEMASLYEALQLKLITVYGGFRIMLKVKAGKRSDNSDGFRPYVALPDSLNIFVRIAMKDLLFNDYTNGRTQSPLFAHYLFSNNPLPNGTHDYPFLPLAIPLIAGGYAYEQGEMAAFGPGDIRQFYQSESGDEWIPVSGSSFANEADRLLVPPAFDYYFRNQTGLTSASFILKDGNGNELKTISANNAAGLFKATLSFGDVAPEDGYGDLTDRFTTLTVSGNNGYARTHRLLLSNMLWGNADWGAVHISSKMGSDNYSVLDDEGFLKEPFPAFEIPVKSRLAFWKYNNNRNRGIQLTAALADYFRSDGPSLVTLKPYPISQSQVFLSNNTNTGIKFFPNPQDFALGTDGNNRIMYNIQVPDSSLFPEV